ncbi:hypothetical protein Tco_1478696, partial [Tanacetum coccineum]
MSSTVTEIRSEQDMNAPGANSVTSVKSVTKCKEVSSPGMLRNHCISSPIKSKRFSTAKGRLDFDGSEMAPSDILTSEQDMNAPGPNSVTSVKSVTKCIKVSSP